LPVGFACGFCPWVLPVGFARGFSSVGFSFERSMRTKQFLMRRSSYEYSFAMRR
jgi:hypothetical protein